MICAPPLPLRVLAGCAVLAASLSQASRASMQPDVSRMPPSTATPARPIVIAHRGASGERPEHTLAAYRLAIEQGADFIEPDLVPTRDGVLVARHENALSGTTDVADRAEFAGRRTCKRIDGNDITDWFAEDFTLAELKTLRARERIPTIRPANAAFDGREEIPTLAEILTLVREAEARGKRVGIYPETKHPTFFAVEGRHLDGTPIARDLGTMLLDVLQAHDFTDPDRVFIQSFELGNLLALARTQMPARGVRVPLIFLMGELRAAPPHDGFSQPWDFAALDVAASAGYAGLEDALRRPLGRDLGYADLAAPAVLAWLREQGIAGIGPWKNVLLRPDRSIHPLLADARAAGLEVHPYTLRAELPFQSADAAGRTATMEDEIARLLAAGASGFFCDHPARAVVARDGFVLRD